MRKILKNFIFTSIFIVLSLLIILINFMGYDDKNILLIGLNPILNFLVSFINIIWNEGPSFNMYIAHLVTFIIYGLIIDMLVFPFKAMISVIKTSKNKKEY